MKILHISDLHIGARLGRHSQNPDIKKMLSHIRDFCVSESINLLLIAGDIFDTYNPSGESEDIYYNFLYETSAGGTAIAIIAGNHDNHERLCAPAEFLNRHNIRVEVSLTDCDFTPFEFFINDEKVSITAVPYVYESQTLDSAAAAFDSTEKAAAAYSAEYAKIIERASKKSECGNKILMAHAFFSGAQNCGSERAIQRGNALLVDASNFCADFLYCAFGHLHRCQKISSNAYYSGSIIPISIDEAAHGKKMVMFDTKRPPGDERINIITLPSFSEYKNIKGNFDEVFLNICALNNAYVSIIFTEALNLERQDKIMKSARERDVKIVSQGFDINRINGESRNMELSYNNLSMTNLFEEYLKTTGCLEIKLTEKFSVIAAECETAAKERNSGENAGAGIKNKNNCKINHNHNRNEERDETDIA